MTGPLEGLRVVDAGGIGPGPFAGMMLADMGADVLRIEPLRLLTELDMTRPLNDPLLRGRRSVALDLKNPAGSAALLRLIDRADVLIEGFRPGVAERLGFGPQVCLGRAPRLVYGRVTGFGREGPLANSPGHDINYIAVAGVLAHIGRRGDKPTPPLNLIGDFGGGGMLLAFGVVCALIERSRSGSGQVVDAAMVDGAALLATMVFGQLGKDSWHDELGTNMVDGGAPHYDTYETADGKHIAVGALEPRFFRVLTDRLGINVGPEIDSADPATWADLRAKMTEAFRQRTQAEWCQHFEGTDACVAPVLTASEAVEHPHNRIRRTFVEVDGTMQPAPAPRLEKTPGAISRPPPLPGQHTREALADWGFDVATIDDLHRLGAAASRADHTPT